MVEGITSRGSAVVPAKVLTREQFPEPMQSGLGSTDVFAMENEFARRPATVKRDALLLRQYPVPMESGIGKEDLPGGFRWRSVISGQKNPLQDFVHGIVQIDDVKVLFDVKR